MIPTPQSFQWIWETFFKSKPTPQTQEPPKVGDAPTQPEPTPQPKTRFEVSDKFLSALASALDIYLTSAQGNAIKTIAAECDAQEVTDLRHIAYILATVYHECGFKPIKERRANPSGNAEQRKIWAMQEKYWHTGFYGRGFSQLTWERNYRKFGPIVGYDLVRNPDIVLNPTIAAKILVYGMKHGTFVAHGLESETRLSKYFNDTKTDWRNARRIVNGTFRAAIVEGHAKKIFSVLQNKMVAT